MTQFIQKSDCKFDEGYIIHGDEVINLDYHVKAQLERLDEAWQKYQYLHEQEPFHAAPSLEGFHRITADEDNRKWQLLPCPETPALDKRMADSLAFRDDCIKLENTEKVNAFAVNELKELLDFCASPRFFEGYGMPEQIDCVSLGNPLELTVDDVLQMLLAIAEEDVDIAEE